MNFRVKNGLKDCAVDRNAYKNTVANIFMTIAFFLRGICNFVDIASRGLGSQD